ncbi:folate-binding protein YgfZ [Nocardioides sp.]|uniref:CAF17-like 4Fe-4S cluster assembly/insertion protein YgfZ n=1 Tax=Nocardioides sp. TaxID=35761 RepID=UPI00271AFFCD|nr:folate-binding protein [Nocardioides sp.]MDO9454972.1 folate-binding protein [Nocardioides sp.]
MSSPLLALPRAVAGNGIDAPVAAHYGSFNGEQRTVESGEGFVDLSHHDVLRIEGPDRLTWLHNITTQHLTDLQPGVLAQALVLSPQGHVEHEFRGTDDGEALTVWTEPGRAAALAEFLERMKFMMRAEITDVTADLALTWRPATGHRLVPRADLTTYAAATEPAAGLWAYEALRIARGEPRFGLDTDHRTIPNEVGWIGPAVHLDKGCYRGQETVARVHTLGRPPRRLTLLHLDGSENRLPAVGSDVILGEKSVGFVGTSARHHELGPIALALLKRNTQVDVDLMVDGIAAAQEVVVDPEVGLHVRPKLR